jgi:hypothetical protein
MHPLVVAAVLVSALAATPAAAQGQGTKARLGGFLVQLATEVAEKGAAAAEELARARGLRLRRRGPVTLVPVILEPRPGVRARDVDGVLVRVAAPAGGLVLIACGLFQLTPLKDTCLRHCRLPFLFLGHHWRDGLGGALLLGAHHGLYCAGCCASLMVVLLVVGMMDLAWMVGLSALIYLEKVLPGGALVGRLAGIALCGAGVTRIVA